MYFYGYYISGKKLQFLLLSLLFYASVIAQPAKTDSLLRLLNTAKEDTGKVMLYWQAGFSVIYQNPPDALPYFHKGIALAKKFSFNRGLERCYAAVSTSYAYVAQYDSQLVYIDTAIIYARMVQDAERLALVYLNKGDALNNLGRFNEAIHNCDTALTFAEKAGNKDRLGRIFYILADIYIKQEQYSRATGNLERSQAYFEQAANKQMLGMCYSNLADIYFRENSHAKAITFYGKAIQMAKEVEDISNLGAYYNSIAEVYLKDRKFTEAETAAKQAIDYSRQAENIMQEALVHDIISRILKGQGRYNEAITEGLTAYKILYENNEAERKATVATNLAELYHKTGNINEAYKYLQTARDLNDSLVKEQFNTETARLQTQFDVAQKNKEIQLLNKDKELQQQKLQKQRVIMIGAVVLVLVAVFGIWLVMNRNKLKQRMKELELRNQIAADLHDEVGSSLSSINMLSQMAVQQGDSGKQKEILTRVGYNAKETMDKMSDIVWMIKPGETEAGSLKQRMERFAYDIGGSKNIELQMQLTELEKLKLTMEQRKNIYLVFKEAMNNAAKYSGTEKIEVMAVVQNKELVLLVKDYGKGFDKSLIKKGNGLDNMQHRAKELNGVLQAESSIKTGTTIKMTVPV